MSAAIPPLPNTPSCRAAELKHRDNFTFNFTFTDRRIGFNKNLSTEIRGMWNMKYIIITVIIGATGIVTKEIKSIWEKNSRVTFSRLRKAVVLGTSDIIKTC
jgi:hypothetical protein